MRASNTRVLEIGAGRGRNTAALRAEGLQVHAVADQDAQTFAPAARSYDAAISTHAFLHGTPASVRRMLETVAGALKADAPFYCTFASKRDARFGKGRRVDTDTYEPESGDEAGVAHVYFDEDGLRSALGDAFVIDSLHEETVDEIAGSWAHARRPTGSIHWFLLARRA